jgi:hypothetical protein
VVTPTFNVAPYVERAILSASRQTFSDLEIIVVDDGSSDDTVSIVAGLMGRCPGLRLLEYPHRGVSFARNAGVKAAVGEYIAFLDGDDIWHPTKIEKQLAALERHGPGSDWVASYCHYRWIREDDTLIQDGPQNSARGYCYASHLSNNHVGNGSNLLVRRDAILAENGFDTSLSHCEDYDLQLRILRHGKIELVPEYLIGYRRRPNSASTRYEEAADAYHELSERYCSDPMLPDDVRRAAQTSAHRHAWYQYFKGGAIARGFRSYLAFLAAEPLEAVLDLGIRAGRTVMQLPNVFSRRRRPATVSGAPLFQDLEPHSSASLGEPGWRLNISARFEQWRTDRMTAQLKDLDDRFYSLITDDMRANEPDAQPEAFVPHQRAHQAIR